VGVWQSDLPLWIATSIPHAQLTTIGSPCSDCMAKIKKNKVEVTQRLRKVRNTTDHLIWLTARLLSSAGQGGTVFFPTNLCAPFKKGDFQHNQEDIRTCRFARCLEKTKELCGHTGAYVDECREDQTSSWCTKCTTFCGYLGASSTFHCPNQHCKHVFGRDEAAARSIMLFTLIKNAVRSVTRACGRPQSPADEAPPSQGILSSTIPPGEDTHSPDQPNHTMAAKEADHKPQPTSLLMSGQYDSARNV
jgi:hypothetical protein